MEQQPTTAILNITFGTKTGCIQKDGVYRYYIRTNDGYNIFVGLDTYKQALKDKIWLSKVYK